MGAQFTCQLKPCREMLFVDRNQFRQYLKDRHDMKADTIAHEEAKVVERWPYGIAVRWDKSIHVKGSNEKETQLIIYYVVRARYVFGTAPPALYVP